MAVFSFRVFQSSQLVENEVKASHSEVRSLPAGRRSYEESAFSLESLYEK